MAAGLARIHRGTVKHTYRYALKGFSIHEIPEAAAIALSQNPQVEFVEENGEGSVGTTQTITYPGGPWGLDRIDQTDIGPGGTLSGTYTYTQTGAGVNAYVIDTGLRTTHSQFGGRASFGADFVNDGQANNADCTTGVFTEGHGTLVASIAGGHTTDPQQTSFGVAKSVNLYKVRVCDCFGSCPAATIAAGVDWVTGHHIKPAVANVSLFLSGGSQTVDKAVRQSMAAGVTYVVIAGNSAPFQQPIDAGLGSPARVTGAITVGATGSNSSPFISDTRASFSNFGAVLDLFAPVQGFQVRPQPGTRPRRLTQAHH